MPSFKLDYSQLRENLTAYLPPQVRTLIKGASGRDLVKKMLDTKLVTLNEASGALIGFYPLHAVAANGVRNMYDFLTKELPEGRKTPAMLEPPTRRPSAGACARRP